MKLTDALRAIKKEDPNAILTKVLMWRVSDLIDAIESGNSGYEFLWTFEEADYLPRITAGLGYQVNKLDRELGEAVVFNSPSPKLLGLIGGQRKTAQKKRASIENGKKGGRPHFFVQLRNGCECAAAMIDTAPIVQF